MRHSEITSAAAPITAAATESAVFHMFFIMMLLFSETARGGGLFNGKATKAFYLFTGLTLYPASRSRFIMPASPGR